MDSQTITHDGALPNKRLMAKDLPIPENSNTHSKKGRRVDISGDTDTSAPGGALGTVLRAASEYLLIADEDLVPIVLASVAAHRLDVSPVWLLLVGAPSTGKTEVLYLTKE